MLLAVFMTSILVIWAVKLVDHAGLLHGHAPRGDRPLGAVGNQGVRGPHSRTVRASRVYLRLRRPRA